jgi:tetratricopeptide (TPR) repeat protein/biotin operon repressor/energy-coupling factor transporter ATP-binding protein EcfA2
MPTADDTPRDGLDPTALLDVVAKRREILAALTDDPLYKRDIIERLDTSRSTVDRAITELLEHGLVEATDGRYRATMAGTLALKRHETYRSEMGDIAAGVDILAAVPDEAPLDAALLTGATLHRFTEHTRQETLSLLDDVIREATTVHGVLPRLSDSRILDAYYSQAHRPNTSARILLSQKLGATLRKRFQSDLSAIAGAEGTSLYEGATPPLGFVWTQGETKRAYVIIYTTDGGIAAVLEHTEANATREIAERVETHIAAATEVTAELSQLHTARGGPAAGRDEGRLPQAVEAEGFLELSDGLFDRHGHVSMLVSWRTGISLSGVKAGHSIPRQHVMKDGTTVDASQHLHDRLRGGTDMLVVGPPGSGKSTLCKQVAASWYDEGGAVLYREASAGCDFESVVELKRYLTSRDERVLVVVEDVVAGNTRHLLQLRQQFAGTNEVTFLFDAREREWEEYTSGSVWTGSPGLTRYAMPQLTREECAQLLTRAGDLTGTDLGLEPATLYEEVRNSDAGATGSFYVAVHRVARLADPLSIAGASPTTTLASAAAETFELLQSRGQTALDVGVLISLLNVCSIPISPELVYAVGDREFVDEAIGVLNGIVVFPSSAVGGLDAVPPTVHAAWSDAFLCHVIEQLGERGSQETVSRVLGAVLELAAAPGRRETIRGHISETGHLFDRIEDDPVAWQEAFMERVFNGLESRPAMAPLVGESVFAEVPAKVQPLQRYRWAGDLALTAGNPDQAREFFEALAEKATESGSVTFRSLALLGLGRSAKQQSRYDEAEQLLAESLALTVRDRTNESVFEALLELGIVAEKTGEFDLATKRYEAAHRYAADSGDPVAEGRALQNLGTASQSRGEYETAIEYGRQALDRYEAHGERLLEAKVRSNLGNAFTRLSRFEEAETAYHRALDIDTDIGRDPGVAAALTNLGDLERLRGNYEEALAYTKQAESLYRRIGDEHRISICLNNIGRIHEDLGNIDAALEAHEEAYGIRQEVGNPHAIGITEHNLATCALAQDDLTAAKAYLDDSMRHLDEAGNTYSVAMTRTVLADVHRREDDPETAIEELETAVMEFEKCGSTNAKADAVADLIAAHAAAGDIDTAQAYARTSRHDAGTIEIDTNADTPTAGDD